MKNTESVENDTDMQKNVVFYALQLLVLSIILIKSYQIIEPFLNVLLWGIILAIALQPLHSSICKRLKGRKTIAAMLIMLSMLLLIIVPAGWLILTSVEEIKELKNAVDLDQVVIPAPNETVKDWPIVGENIYSAWNDLSLEKTAFIFNHKEELKPVVLQVISLISSAGKGILIFIGAIILSGVLLIYSESITKFSQAFFVKIAGIHGIDMNNTITSTIQNVAKGILGVAFLQSTLVGIGLVVAGVPLAGLWAVICLLLAIVQIGIFPVSLGVIIYIWGSADTTTALLLTIWIGIMSVMDNILKPILMGKGAPAPMLIVFVGTIGGFIANGFIGLFTGAIILTIVYNLFISWLAIPKEPEEELITTEIENIPPEELE